MEKLFIIFACCFCGFCIAFLIYYLSKHPDGCLPFPKKVKFKKALLWWLSAGWRTYDKRGRRKYCSECGWPIVYIDELYDENYIRESLTPDVIAVCSLCGTEFVEFESWSTNIKAVLPKVNRVE